MTSLKELYVAYSRAVTRFKMTKSHEAKKRAKAEADKAWDTFDDEVTRHMFPPKQLEKLSG